MQSDNRTVTKIELATQQETKEQFNDQQKPESSGQRHHSPGVDGKSLEELLDPIAEDLQELSLGSRIDVEPSGAIRKLQLAALRDSSGQNLLKPAGV